jgi:hypothetical protein
MTERHVSPHGSHLNEVVQWHPIRGPREQAGADCAVEATTIETYGFINSGELEGN